MLLLLSLPLPPDHFLQVNHTNEQENLTDELFLPLVAALAKYDTVSGAAANWSFFFAAAPAGMTRLLSPLIKTPWHRMAIPTPAL